MSQPDRVDIGVDFAPPAPPNRLRRPVLAAVLAAIALGAVTVAVTQLLLR